MTISLHQWQAMGPWFFGEWSRDCVDGPTSVVADVVLASLSIVVLGHSNCSSVVTLSGRGPF